MNVFLPLLLPIWFLSFSALLLALTDARLGPAVSSISDTVLLSQQVPISQLSAEMEADSPGMPEVRIVHHQDLNKSILIALIVASTLLAGILMLFSCFWIYRLKNLKNSSGKSQQSLDTAKGLSLGSIFG
ncbi:hypothetical protein L1049_004642 [Liquidambar formosana]|uniref:Uncharacterized protein n=1 Tax=Liquidambar formosana TaxID=63359 RepID=A0AAP0X0X2_LIQFO